MRILTLLFAALLTLPALAQNLALPPFAQDDELGGFLTVHLDSVPESVSRAYVRLDQETQLDLSRNSDGTWAGSFLLLPGFYDGLPSPEMTLRDSTGAPVSSTKVRFHCASSTLEPADLPLALSVDGVAVVMDPYILGDTIRLVTRDGKELAPEFGSDSFSLPQGVEPGSIVGVNGLGIHGQEFVFEAPWDVDVATPED